MNQFMMKPLQALRLYAMGMVAGTILIIASFAVLHAAHANPVETEKRPCPQNSKAAQ